MTTLENLQKKDKEKPPDLPFDKPENEADRPTPELQLVATTDQRVSEFKKYLELAEEKTVIKHGLIVPPNIFAHIHFLMF